MADELPYKNGENGKCPHCGHMVNFDNPQMVDKNRQTYANQNTLLVESGGDKVYLYSCKCPNPDCEKPIITKWQLIDNKIQVRLVHPFNLNRLVPNVVPENIRSDFLEAAAVLAISEKASAALSRRCLQNLLNDKGIAGRTLDNQIDNAMTNLPSRLSENIDMIRTVGNFAAHPLKAQSTGLICEVEPEEAAWNLEVLEDLFDYYYVQPLIAQERRKKLDAKLQGLGKPPLKKPATSL